MPFLVRLYRILPLLIILAFVAVVVYFVVSWRTSPNRAKELLIKIFTWIFIVLTALFGLATLYAAGEANQAVAELFGSFAAVTLIGLGVTRLCKWRFVKHHPHFKDGATVEAEVIHPKPWWWPFGRKDSSGSNGKGPKNPFGGNGPFNGGPGGPFGGGNPFNPFGK